MGTVENRIAKTLDECLRRVRQGEPIEDCLAHYPGMREEIAPLLFTSLDISASPRIVASGKFRKESRARLVNLLRQEAAQEARKQPGLRETMTTIWQRLLPTFTPVQKALAPATLVVILLLVISIGIPNIISPSPVLAAQCTLSLLNGSTEVQPPNSEEWQEGTDGMTLTAGTRIRTAADSQALLTFFEGSTITLTPGTDIEIQQLGQDSQQKTTIVLKQRMGRTWNRVVKMTDAGSHYQIDTPAATAMVRGTLFTTEVLDDGQTRVATTEGLVSVIAQGQEIYLPPHQETQVSSGEPPAPIAPTPAPGAEIIINVAAPVVASIIDPSGASTGYLPGGKFFNQIPGSQSYASNENSQVITIPQPVSGEYTVLLRYPSAGTAGFSVQGTSKNNVAFNYAGTYEGNAGNGWLIRFNLQIHNGEITDSEVTGVTPLGNQVPEKIIEPRPLESKPVKQAALPGSKSGQIELEEKNSPRNQAAESARAAPATGKKTEPVNNPDESNPPGTTANNKSTPGNDTVKANAPEKDNRAAPDVKQNQEDQSAQAKNQDISDRQTTQENQGQPPDNVHKNTNDSGAGNQETPQNNNQNKDNDNRKENTPAQPQNNNNSPGQQENQSNQDNNPNQSEKQENTPPQNQPNAQGQPENPKNDTRQNQPDKPANQNTPQGQGNNNQNLDNQGSADNVPSQDSRQNQNDEPDNLNSQEENDSKQSQKNDHDPASDQNLTDNSDQKGNQNQPGSNSPSTKNEQKQPINDQTNNDASQQNQKQNEPNQGNLPPDTGKGKKQ